MENDPVNHPSHYTDGKYETIDFIEAWGLGFHLGNAAKYISRAGKKNPDKKIEDLEKAAWYLKRASKARWVRLYKDDTIKIPIDDYCNDKGLNSRLSNAITSMCQGFPKMALAALEEEIDFLKGEETA